MYYIHFSEFERYKRKIALAAINLLDNPSFRRKKPDWLIENYYQGKYIPQELVEAVNAVLQSRGVDTPLDYNTMGFLVSDLVYQGWEHDLEEWSDYYVMFDCIVNGKPIVFRNTHPSYQELASFDSEFARCCNQLNWNDYDREFWRTLIENVLSHYLMGDIFEELFNGNAKNLPSYIRNRLNDDVITIYFELYGMKSGVDNPLHCP